MSTQDGDEDDLILELQIFDDAAAAAEKSSSSSDGDGGGDRPLAVEYMGPEPTPLRDKIVEAAAAEAVGGVAATAAAGGGARGGRIVSVRVGGPGGAPKIVTDLVVARGFNAAKMLRMFGGRCANGGGVLRVTAVVEACRGGVRSGGGGAPRAAAAAAPASSAGPQRRRSGQKKRGRSGGDGGGGVGDQTPPPARRAKKKKKTKARGRSIRTDRERGEEESDGSEDGGGGAEEASPPAPDEAGNDRPETAGVDGDDDDNAGQEVTYYQTAEAGSTYQARVISHSFVGGGKFLVEWTLAAVHRPPTAAASEMSSSSSQSSLAHSRGGAVLCTSWVNLKELVCPSAALEYLDGGGDVSSPPWENHKLRQRLVRYLNEYNAQNKVEVDGDDKLSLNLAEVDFCCFLCQCPRCPGREDEVQRCKFVDKSHRCCCHSLTDDRKKEDFCSSLGRAQKKVIAALEKDGSGDESRESGDEEARTSPSNGVNEGRYDREQQRFLDERIRSARRDEARSEGDYYSRPAQETVRQTDPVALRVDQDFARICRERREDPDLKRRAVVLDVFSGIGCAIVALKKLGVDMERVISVDHDRVAQHVYRFHHDESYGDSAVSDGVEHICGLCETFEELCEEGGAENLVQKYGPIDIVVGGPPCQDYSAVNARRTGGDDPNSSGKYMKRFAAFIGKIRELNRRLHDGFDDLFFMVENVPGSEKATEDYRVSEFRCNASAFGPCHRDRVFYFNWQPNAMPEDNSAVGASSCFDDGWMMPAMFKHGVDSKSLTLLASKTRIKDDTLYKWKIKEGLEKSIMPGEDRPASHALPLELFSTNDRERLMGLPLDYVREPVSILFNEVRKAFMVGLGTEQWRDVVSPKYWNFLSLGPGGHSFSINDGFESFSLEKYVLKIKEANQKAKVCMDAEEYGWHLIGNGFSIPQVMYLLQPLQVLFHRKEYAGYTDHKFAWEDSVGADLSNAVGTEACGDGSLVNERNPAAIVPKMEEASTDLDNTSNDELSV